MKRGICCIFLSALCACGADCSSNSIDSSNGFPSSETSSFSTLHGSDVTYRNHEYPFPEINDGEKARFAASLPIRQFAPNEGEGAKGMRLLWGDYTIPYFITERVTKSSVFPGNVITVDVETSGGFENDVIPPIINFRDSTVYSVQVTKGLMVEAAVKEGKVQYTAAGLLGPSLPIYEEGLNGFGYALASDGSVVNVNAMEKVYVAVSANNPRIPLGLFAYPFQ